MSERAIATLRDLFKGLEFFAIDSTTARDPEDILYIDLQKPICSWFQDSSAVW